MPRGIPYGPGQLFSGGNSSPKLKCFLPVDNAPNQSWVLSETGVWRFYAWGTGSANTYIGSAHYGAASGGLSIISKFLSAGETVNVELSPTRTKLVFPDASEIQILAATIGSNPGTPTTAKGGIASGGEININGTDGVLGNANGLPGGGTDGGLGGVANSSVPGGAGAPGAEGIRGGNGLRYAQSTSGGSMAPQRGAGRGFPGSSELNYPVANSGEVIALKVG